MHERLIQALLDRSRYPHSVREIELRETHISWVLLTGDYAYKIKKPVKLSFLDFSTLALRKHFCEEELRLNRRFAPGLYIGVVAITGTLDAPRVGGNGPVRDGPVGDAPVIEYAVQLKQFAASDELTHLLAAGQVSQDDAGQFGHQLATIHAQLPHVTDGSPDSFEHSVELNLDDLQHYLPRDARIAALCESVLTLQTRLASTLRARYRTDAIRECHGDLHAGNVVRIGGKLVPFDCIEFDAALRNIDVLNDLAFLFMDLSALGHRDLAYCVLNAWLEQNGDYAGLPLLRYYAAHRALVRAKVAAMQSRDASCVDRYLTEAQRYLASAQSHLIITCGLSGSGKTWLSKQLAPLLPAVHIRSDVERKRLAGLPALASSKSATGAGIYTSDFNTHTYARLVECARSALTDVRYVIVDAACLRRSERAAFRACATELGAQFTIIHCTAPETALRSRIAARQAAANDASEATAEVLVQQFGYWESFAADEQAYVVEFDSAGASVAALCSQLAAKQMRR